ncbi:hypothetical protein JMUB6875_11620 [Nocardia sp. JMUB6875]
MTAPIRRGGEGRARDGYAGPQIHCTHWRDQRELDRLHVAVIGGGTALARVVPPVVAQARRVTVFQHDPIWILPTPPIPGARALLRQLPSGLLGTLRAHTAASLPGALDAAGVSAPPRDGAASAPGRPTGSGAPAAASVMSGLEQVGAGIMRWCGHLVLRRVAEANLRAQVGDSWQRRQLTPDRPADVRVHGRYYRALGRDNCTLISWPIARLAPLGIRTVDGVEHRVDCIIYAEESL